MLIFFLQELPVNWFELFFIAENEIQHESISSLMFSSKIFILLLQNTSIRKLKTETYGIHIIYHR